MQAHWTRKALIFPPLLFGGGVLAYLVVFKTPPVHAPPVEQAHHVRVIEAVATEVVPRVLGYGSVRPSRVWNAVAQVSGKIEHIHPDFKKGAIVPAETELLRISPKDYKLAIMQAKANIRSSEARLKELQISEQNTRSLIDIETNAMTISRRELARVQKLLKRGITAQATVDKEEHNFLVQQKKLHDLNNALRLLPAQISAQKEQIAVYLSQLETAKLNLERTSIRLPFAARIAEKNVEITQFVGVGQQLGSADGMKTAEIEAQVSQSRFRALIAAIVGPNAGRGVTRNTLQQFAEKLGLHARVRLRFDDRDALWTGRIAQISDTVDPKTRTIGVIVAVDDVYEQAIAGQRPPLFKGMFVEVEVRANPVNKGIVVPRSVVHGGNIYVVNGESRLDIRPVETGLIQGDILTITKGVTAGERVVVSDLSPAIKGMLLKPLPDQHLATRLKRTAAGEEALK